MTRPKSSHGFWGEFWPKALLLAAIVASLWLLEHYGIIRRWLFVAGSSLLVVSCQLFGLA